MQKEIEAKLSGIDDVLSKALKGINCSEPVAATAKDIFNEVQSEKQKAKEEFKYLNKDVLSRNYGQKGDGGEG